MSVQARVSAISQYEQVDTSTHAHAINQPDVFNFSISQMTERVFHLLNVKSATVRTVGHNCKEGLKGLWLSNQAERIALPLSPFVLDARHRSRQSCKAILTLPTSHCGRLLWTRSKAFTRSEEELHYKEGGSTIETSWSQLLRPGVYCRPYRKERR